MFKYTDILKTEIYIQWKVHLILLLGSQVTGLTCNLLSVMLKSDVRFRCLLCSDYTRNKNLWLLTKFVNNTNFFIKKLIFEYGIKETRSLPPLLMWSWGTQKMAHVTGGCVLISSGLYPFLGSYIFQRQHCLWSHVKKCCCNSV